jgi:hypothetical protein
MPPCAILTPATSTRRGGEGVLHLTVTSRTGKIATIAVVAAATAASLFVWQSVLHTGVQPLSLWPQLPGFANETVDFPTPDHSTGGSASSSSRQPVGAPLRRAQTSTPLPSRSRPRRLPPAGKAQPSHPPVTGSQPAPPNPETPTAPTPTAPTPTVPTPTVSTPTVSTPIAASPAPEPATKPRKSTGRRTLALQRADQARPAKQRAAGPQNPSQQSSAQATSPQQPPRADAHAQPQSPQPPGRARAGDNPHPSTPGPPGPPQAQPTSPHTTTPPQPSQEKHDQQPAEPHSAQPPPPAANAPKPPSHGHP